MLIKQLMFFLLFVFFQIFVVLATQTIIIVFLIFFTGQLVLIICFSTGNVKVHIYYSLLLFERNFVRDFIFFQGVLLCLCYICHLSPGNPAMEIFYLSRFLLILIASSYNIIFKKLIEE